MNSVSNADSLVAINSENIGRYKRNFLHKVVCELRFPTLLEFGDPKPPHHFVSALRKDYPHLDTENEVTLGIGANSAGSSSKHILRSQKKDWSVVLRQSAISLESFSYKGFKDFLQRVEKVITCAEKIIDSEFFTRVGLRYINIIPSDQHPEDGWINSALIAPVQTEIFLSIREFAGRLRVENDNGGCFLQHGIERLPKGTSQQLEIAYRIDIDAYRNEIYLTDTIEILQGMHKQVFDVFDWSIGEKTRESLSKE